MHTLNSTSSQLARRQRFTSNSACQDVLTFHGKLFWESRFKTTSDLRFTRSERPIHVTQLVINFAN